MAIFETNVYDDEALVLIHRRTHPLSNRIFKDVSTHPALILAFYFHDKDHYKVVTNFVNRGKRYGYRLIEGDAAMLLFSVADVHKRFIKGDFQIITSHGEEKFEIALLKLTLAKELAVST